MTVCSVCGQENPEAARFCMRCSSPLGEQGAQFRVRKTVTVLFCDLTGSTALGERLDPEAIGHVLARYYRAVRAVIEYHGGTVAKFIGDAVMGVFGIPTLHEDDAVRAVRAAADIPDAIAALNAELVPRLGAALQVRIGVNTGEVVAGDPSMGDSLITGDAVNVAARLEQAASPGDILIGRATYGLVRDAVEVDELTPVVVRGKSDPLEIYRLRGVKPQTAGHARRMDSPMVGRERHRRHLRQVFDNVRLDRSCHLFTLLGDAGVGKSRLVAELVREVGSEATVVQGRCLPYGEGITYWPVVEVLRQSAGVNAADAPADQATTLEEWLRDGGGSLARGFADDSEILDPLRDIAGLADLPTTMEQRYWAIRRLFEELGRDRPVIVAFDDIHWGEPAFLDLLEYVADWARGSALLLLCMARPELLDIRPAWGGGKFNAATILLEPLTVEESKALVRNLLEEGSLPEPVLNRILEAAEGNPLFLEEMLGMLVDDSLLSRSDGRWTAGDLSSITVPPTIQALIAARLDRLTREERTVVERAAIVGKEFSMRPLGHLLGEDEAAALSARVMALVRKDILQPGIASPGGDGYRFRHLFMQDAAYAGIPKGVRAELHERFAHWIEREHSDGLQEYEEIIGHHLEQAANYVRELGISEERAIALSRRAALRLGAAGTRAYARADAAAAGSLLTRALALLPERDAGRLELLPAYGATKGDLGDLPGAEVAYREAIDLAAVHGRDDVGRHAEIALEHLRLATAPREPREMIAIAHEAIAALDGSGNDHALALAWFLVVLGRQRLGHFVDARIAAERALEHARAARLPRQEADACGLALASAFLGSTPLPEVAALASKMLSESGGNRLLEVWMQGQCGVAEILGGNEESGRKRFATVGPLIEEMGLDFAVAAMESFIGDCELALGNWQEALRRLEGAYLVLAKIGDDEGAAAVAGALARSHLILGDAERARKLSDERAAHIPDSALHLRSRWLSPLPLLLAQQGSPSAAIELCRSRIEALEATDAVMQTGDACMDAAEVLAAAGRAEEAVAEAERALRLYRAKGEHPSAARARRLLDRIGGGPRPG